MAHILVNRFFYPDHSATSQFLSDLAFDLGKDGWDVHVITSRQRYGDPAARLLTTERVGGVTIHRVWTTRFGRGRVLGRALDYITFYSSAAWRLWRLAAVGDVIVAKTDPPLISVFAAVVAHLRAVTLVNWIQDLFPEVASALEVRGMNGWSTRQLRRLRNASLRFARINVLVGEGMAARLREEGISADRVRVIHNWADGLAIQPQSGSENPLRQKWRLADKFVVGYSGNMGRAHEFATILEAAELLNSEPDIVFLFIGDGVQRSWLERSAKARNLRNLVFKPYQPRERLAQSLSVPDVHLVSLRSGLEGLTVPSKFYGAAAAGRPILYIGNRNGEIARLVHETGCGAVISPGDVTGLVSQIRGLDADGDLCRDMGQKARAVVEERFEKRLALSAWKQLLSSF